jgi:spermidine synthase
LINRDRNLRLQYLAGLSLNQYVSGPIYAEILAYRKPPTDLFVGNEDSVRAVLAAIENGSFR